MTKKKRRKIQGQQPDRLEFTLNQGAKKILTALFVLAFFLALFLRFNALELKPLHHDEGVNSWFLLNLKKDFPAGWKYDPENYHGPFLFFTHIIPLAINESVFSLRCLVALFGSLTILLLWPLRRTIGRTGVVTAAFLLAVSPTNLFFARTNIHETYLIFFTLGTVVGAIRFRESKKPVYFILMCACWAWVITVKETYIMTGGAFFWAAVGTYFWFSVTRKRDQIAPRTVITDLVKWMKEHYPALGLAVLVFVLIIVVYYSSLFTNLKGTTGDLINSLLIWRKTGTKGAGHEKPWWYWCTLLKDFELPVLVLGGLGIVYAFIRRNAFMVFSSLWALLLFLAYTAVPYKTPWLAMNFILPLALLAGYFAENLYRSIRGSPLLVTIAGAAGAAALLAGGSGISWRVNFVEYDDDSHQIVYSQTRRDINDMMTRLEEYAHNKAQGYDTEIKIVSDEYWPLQWYLRKYIHVGYWGQVIADSDAPIVLGRSKTQEELEKTLKDTYYSELYSVRPGLDLFLYTRLHRGKKPEEEIAGTEPVAVEKEALQPGLRARYYKKINPVGEPHVEKIEDRFDFHYNNEEEKKAGLNITSPFSILWEGLIEIPRSGTYLFATESDDGSWLLIDDRVVVNNGGTHGIQYKSNTIILEEGMHRIGIKYFDSAWGAVMKVRWSPPGEGEGPIPPRYLWHQN
ncbi:MAG: flippase activity-associated protein Agl23 [PVC group bacterium]